MSLTKTFSSVSYIPKAVLATVIMCAVMHMFDPPPPLAGKAAGPGPFR